MAFAKIMIAVDSSEFSMQAAKKGLELAHLLHAKTALVYVVDTSKAIGDIDAGLLPEQELLILKKEAAQTMDQLAKMYDGDELMKFMPEGHPDDDIIKTATAWGADLIVLGTHGRTGLAGLLMGSMAEHLVKHSPIPVMVVPFK
jgi:nucleotide-binding universal stress UspA family protein